MDAKTIEALEMTKEELDEIRRIWAAARPGPWVWLDLYNGEQSLHEASVITHHARICDTEAIAAAPTHIAKLIAEVDRLREPCRMLCCECDIELGEWRNNKLYCMGCGDV